MSCSPFLVQNVVSLHFRFYESLLSPSKKSWHPPLGTFLAPFFRSKLASIKIQQFAEVRSRMAMVRVDLYETCKYIQVQVFVSQTSRSGNTNDEIVNPLTLSSVASYIQWRSSVSTGEFIFKYHTGPIISLSFIAIY